MSQEFFKHIVLSPMFYICLYSSLLKETLDTGITGSMCSELVLLRRSTRQFIFSIYVFTLLTVGGCYVDKACLLGIWNLV